MSLSSGTISDIAAITTVAAVSVTDSSAVSHAMTALKTFVFFQNTGAKAVWFGDSAVDPSASRGALLLPKVGFTVENVKATFSVYFKCASGDSSTISIIEG